MPSSGNEDENFSLCPAAEKNPRNYGNCLWLSFYQGVYGPKENERKKRWELLMPFNRKEALLLATFDASEHGHLGMWPGGLKNVDYLRTEGGVDSSCIYFDAANERHQSCQK